MKCKGDINAVKRKIYSLIISQGRGLLIKEKYGKFYNNHKIVAFKQNLYSSSRDLDDILGVRNFVIPIRSF